METLETIQVVSRDGPRPLPERAEIQTFGCLRSATADKWKLTGAAAFTRGRNRKELNPDELKRLDEQSPGQQIIEIDTTFFRFRHKNTDLSIYKDRKIVVRGILQSAKTVPRVMLLYVQPIGSNCR